MKGFTEEQQERRWRSGRGQGAGSDYKPWIEVNEFPNSDGARTSLKGLLTGRMHACLSKLERCAILVAQRLPDIVDIREQFPLPLEDTDRIAAAIGVKPPEFQGHGQRVTTDLLLTFEKDGRRWEEAVAIKPSFKLEEERVQELLSLEFVFWTEKGVAWRIGTELEFTKTLLSTLDWLNQHAFLVDPRLDRAFLDIAERSLLTRLRHAPDMPVNQLCLEVDDAVGNEPGLMLTALRHFIAVGRWCVDVRADLGPRHPLPRPFHVPHIGETFEA